MGDRDPFEVARAVDDFFDRAAKDDAAWWYPPEIRESLVELESVKPYRAVPSVDAYRAGGVYPEGRLLGCVNRLTDIRLQLQYISYDAGLSNREYLTRRIALMSRPATGCLWTTRSASTGKIAMTDSTQRPDHSALDDIPGTTVFTRQRSRRGFHLNQFCMSLMKLGNRERFKADERAYLDEWQMTEAQKTAVLDRDYNAMIAEGGNIYFLAKIFATDGQSFQDVAGMMTGMSPEDYAAMMIRGGRSPEGQRSIKDGN